MSPKGKSEVISFAMARLTTARFALAAWGFAIPALRHDENACLRRRLEGEPNHMMERVGFEPAIARSPSLSDAVQHRTDIQHTISTIAL